MFFGSQVDLVLLAKLFECIEIRLICPNTIACFDASSMEAEHAQILGLVPDLVDVGQALALVEPLLVGHL